MKQLLFSVVFSFFSFSILSCSKATLGLAKVEWSGYYVIDTVLADNEAEATSLAYDCFGDVRIPADTVLPYNHGVPPEVATTWQEIQPETMRYNYVREISPGVWARKYFTFKVRKP